MPCANAIVKLIGARHVLRLAVFQAVMDVQFANILREIFKHMKCVIALQAMNLDSSRGITNR